MAETNRGQEALEWQVGVWDSTPEAVASASTLLEV